MASSNQSDIRLGEYLHLAGVEWAPDPDGSDHCMWLSRLVEYMAQLTPEWGGVVGGPLTMHDVKVLTAVAMLYATGRASPSSAHTDEGVAKTYAAKSASNAERFFRDGGGSGTYWGKPEVREDVCRLIFRHTEPAAISEDKRLQVFQDALAFESVRYGVNTGPGLLLIKERYVPERMNLGWSKSRENFRGWMQARNWR